MEKLTIKFSVFLVAAAQIDYLRPTPLPLLVPPELVFFFFCCHCLTSPSPSCSGGGVVLDEVSDVLKTSLPPLFTFHKYARSPTNLHIHIQRERLEKKKTQERKF